MHQNREWCRPCSSVHSMNDAFVLQNFASFAEVITNVSLGADPINVTTDAVAEIDSRFVTSRASERRVANEMSHFAGTKFAVDLRRDVDAQSIGKLFGDFANRRAAAAANVHWQSVELDRFRGKQIRSGDVFHERKVACLLPVFVQNRWKIVHNTRA